jgi:hypothetical protein
MLRSPQVLRFLNTQIECTSFQMFYMGLSKCRRLSMLGLRYFFWSMGMLWGVQIRHSLLLRFIVILLNLN